MNSNRYRPWLTYVLVGINVAVFLIEEVMGGSTNTEVALYCGALYPPLVTQYGQWWRIFTAMWLHFGIQHIGSNMISLLVIGPYVEAYFGRVGYAILYLGAGICGNLLVTAVDTVTGSNDLSAGASGAICGLLSVFIIFALTPGLRQRFPLRRVLFSIFLTLLPGLTDRSISMTAHLGGLIGGLVIAAILNAVKMYRMR